MQIVILLFIITLPIAIISDSKKRFGKYYWGWAVFSTGLYFLVLPQIFKTFRMSDLSASTNNFAFVLGGLIGGWSGIFSIYKFFTRKEENISVLKLGEANTEHDRQKAAPTIVPPWFTRTFESWVSYRYLLAKKDRFLSMINFVAVAGIAIGVMALIVVIGVMTGFDRDLREKIIGTNAHVMVERETGLKNYPKILNELNQIPGIQSSAPYIHGNVFLESNQKAMSLVLRGVDPLHEANITKIDQYLASGKIQDLKPDEVVIGSQLASFYGYRIGDEITLIAPASGVAGEGWRYQLKVAGVFTSGMYDYDMNLIVVHINKAQQIFSLGENVVTGIGIKLNNVYQAPQIKEKIFERIGVSYLVRTWIENNSNFFAALRLEKFAMFVILTLIVLVASFNIISTLIVTVTSKVKDIGILKSIGVPKSSIRKIFTLQGISLGVMGTFWGCVGGVGLSLILKKYQFIKLPQDIYYIDHLPVLLQLNDILAIVGAALAISYLATIYPSGKAANLEPVEALRYE